MEPLVSIVCITYNHELYLRQALDSFLMQKCDFPYEIVLAEDCSTDKTREICEEYANANACIKYIYSDTNVGSAANEGRAIRAARGKYIAFCEGDDYWIDPYKLQKQVDYMKAHPKCGLCVTDFCFQDDLDGEHRSAPAFAELQTFQPHSFEEHLQNAGYIGPMTWLYKKEIYLENIDNYLNIVDGTYALALDLFAKSEVYYLPDVTAVYRVHSGSAANASNVLKKFSYTMDVNRTQLEYAHKYNCKDSVIENLQIQQYVTTIPLALECNNQSYIEEALRYFEKHGFIMTWFVESCREYVKYKQQYEKIRSSKAYRFGKAILKPFKWLKK